MVRATPSRGRSKKENTKSEVSRLLSPKTPGWTAASGALFAEPLDTPASEIGTRRQTRRTSLFVSSKTKKSTLSETFPDAEFAMPAPKPRRQTLAAKKAAAPAAGDATTSPVLTRARRTSVYVKPLKRLKSPTSSPGRKGRVTRARKTVVQRVIEEAQEQKKVEGKAAGKPTRETRRARSQSASPVRKVDKSRRRSKSASPRRSATKRKQSPSPTKERKARSPQKRKSKSPVKKPSKSVSPTKKPKSPPKSKASKPSPKKATPKQSSTKIPVKSLPKSTKKSATAALAKRARSASGKRSPVKKVRSPSPQKKVRSPSPQKKRMVNVQIDDEVSFRTPSMKRVKSPQVAKRKKTPARIVETPKSTLNSSLQVSFTTPPTTTKKPVSKTAMKKIVAKATPVKALRVLGKTPARATPQKAVRILGKTTPTPRPIRRVQTPGRKPVVATPGPPRVTRKRGSEVVEETPAKRGRREVEDEVEEEEEEVIEKEDTSMVVAKPSWWSWCTIL